METVSALSTEIRPTQLGVVDIGSVASLLRISPPTLERLLRKDPTFPRPFKIGNRRHVRLVDLQAWIDRQAGAR